MSLPVSGLMFFLGVSVWFHVPSGGSLSGGISVRRGSLSGETPPLIPHTVDEQAVRILLECFLVYVFLEAVKYHSPKSLGKGDK